MITAEFTREQREEVATILDKLKVSVLEQLEHQPLTMTEDVESKRLDHYFGLVDEASYTGEQIDFVHTGRFRISIGTPDYKEPGE